MNPVDTAIAHLRSRVDFFQTGAHEERALVNEFARMREVIKHQDHIIDKLRARAVYAEELIMKHGLRAEYEQAGGERER